MSGLMGDSEMDDNEEIREGDSLSISDRESVTSERRTGNVSMEPNGVVRLAETDRLREIIGNRFVSRLSEVGFDAQIQEIGRFMFNSSPMTQARLHCFMTFQKALEIKNGDPNVKYAWFGGSNDEISKIILHGFGIDNMKKASDDFNVQGIVFSAYHSPLESVASSSPDEDGVRRILLCRVLLGKTELVDATSTQSHPISEEYQSGVYDLVNPTKYIVWINQMNTHVLPIFVITFKISRKRVSPGMPIRHLIARLSTVLPPRSMHQVTIYNKRYLGNRIPRSELIRPLRGMAGYTLLLRIFRTYTEEMERRGREEG